MPAIHLFGRRTFMGGDDLTTILWVYFLFRLFQVLLVIPLFSYAAKVPVKFGHYNNGLIPGCEHAELFRLLLLIYGVISALNAIAGAVFSWRMRHWARQGCPTETEPRATKLQKLIQWSLGPRSILLCAIVAIGIVLQIYAEHHNRCLRVHENEDLILERMFSNISSLAILISQVADLAVTWTFLFSLLFWRRTPRLVTAGQVPSSMSTNNREQGNKNRAAPESEEEEGVGMLEPNHRSLAEEEEEERIRHAIEENWERRFSCCCKCLGISTCFLLGGRELFVGRDFGNLANDQSSTRTNNIMNFSGIAAALADFFEVVGEGMDLVPSDIMAGFCALQMIQRDRAQSSRKQIAEEEAKSVVRITNNRQKDAITQHTTKSMQPGDAGTFAVSHKRGKQMDLTESYAHVSDIERPSPADISDTANFQESNANINATDMQELSDTATFQEINANTNITDMQERILCKGQELETKENRCTKDSASNSLISGSNIPKETSHVACRMLASGTIVGETNSTTTLNERMPSDAHNEAEIGYHDDKTEGKNIGDEASPGHQPLPTHQKVLNPENAVDIFAIQEGTRYVKHAKAMYTWMMYWMSYPVSGIPRLALRACYGWFQKCQRRRCSSNESENRCDEFIGGQVQRDNLCAFHKAAFLLTLGLTSDADVVYLQLKSGFHYTPYSIVLDHDWQSVVLSIRGTFSLEDAVKDTLVEYASLDQIGEEFGFNGKNQYCHTGVLLTARNVLDDLRRHKLLDKLMVGEEAKYANYTLRIVGHSLGAGAATMLSYMLRQSFPTLRCVSFSPPGCTLSWDLAIECNDWCNAFVLDSDIVPRLSIESLEAWRDGILEGIGRIKVPKADLFRRSRLWNTHHRGRAGVGVDFLADVLHKQNEIPDTDFKRHLATCRIRRQERRDRPRANSNNVPLYPPGSIIHFVQTGEKKIPVLNGLMKCLTCYTTNFHFEYTPVRKRNDDLNEIIVSPRILNDHFPERIQRVITGISNRFKQID